MNKWKKLGIHFLISWLVPFIALLVVSSFYLPVELTTNLVLAFSLFSLIIALFILLYIHDIAHGGHFVGIVGFLTLIYSAGMIYGAFSFGDKIKLWTLSDPEIALYTFTGILGMVGTISGLKQMYSNRYFIRWNPFSKKRGRGMM
ncbi:MAG: hypothetical protein HOD60_08885 [Candidatus Nitrosopelagicus sp.]|nr:hypothetical protein [Candidatus Nitrosopelagicus sp.]